MFFSRVWACSLIRLCKIIRYEIALDWRQAPAVRAHLRRTVGEMLTHKIHTCRRGHHSVIQMHTSKSMQCHQISVHNDNIVQYLAALEGLYGASCSLDRPMPATDCPVDHGGLANRAAGGTTAGCR
ncbi:hypothetical protein D3C81_1758500 [compost metagenome]